MKELQFIKKGYKELYSAVSGDRFLIHLKRPFALVTDQSSLHAGNHENQKHHSGSTHTSQLLAPGNH